MAGSLWARQTARLTVLPGPRSTLVDAESSLLQIIQVPVPPI